MENTEVIDARRKLFEAIAPHLPGWTVQEKQGEEYPGYRFALVDATGRRIVMEPNKGKLHIWGHWPLPGADNRSLTPRDVREDSPAVNVSKEKTPEQIARDISRRFLPEYIRIWDKLAAHKAEGEAYDNRRAANWQRITDSGLVIPHRREDAQSAEVRIKGNNGGFNYDAGYGDIAMSSEDGVTLKLQSLPIDTALRVLRALKGEL
jgi:hypothetical protein